MPWLQAYSPVAGSAGLSAAVAALPLVVVFVCLAVLRMKAVKATSLALLTAFALAVVAWGMPAKLAVLSSLQGAAFGLFPIYFLVLATLFLYNITVKGGQFQVIRSSIAGVTPDRRLQALLIAFCFGAFIEGCAGFGAPVAIAGATLVGLGFRPFYAAGLCLVANTAPVAFGSIGIPIVALAGVMGLNDAGLLKLSAMVGHQLPIVSFIVPFYIVVLMAGFRRTIEVLPAVLTCGGVFATCQWATSSYLGPYLPDIVSSLASMGALLLLLRFWSPRTIFRFEHETDAPATAAAHTGKQVFRAWLPYLTLTAAVLAWGLPPVKAALDRTTVLLPVPGLNGSVVRTPVTRAVVAPPPVAVPAVFKFDYLASGGTAVLVAALLSSLLCGVGAGQTARVFADTLYGMRIPAITFAAVVALAYVMNFSGMTACLGIFCTKAGYFFPFLSPILGWLGVFLTGSDTSSNVLFGGIQKTAAEQLGINPILTCAANTSGGVVGKMISPQSVAVACAATGMVGEEGSLFRFTLKHSLALLMIVSVLVFLQAYCLTWMIPS
jgi:L-lactate transport